jgi:predicted nucleic acid-binding protein
MRILVDANVFLRSAQPLHSQHQVAKHAVADLIRNGHQMSVVPQVIYEFWVVATRPEDRNGLGLSVEQAESEVLAVLNAAIMHRDERGVFDVWWEVVRNHHVAGKLAHDAHLVAAMLRHGITHLLTFNSQDFARFGDIVVIDPANAGAFPPAME